MCKTVGHGLGPLPLPARPRRILRLAAPMSASNLAGYAISMVAIAFVGRLGEEALSVGEHAGEGPGACGKAHACT